MLMGIGMLLHRMARPVPPSPSFRRDVDATVSPLKGKFPISFYVPKDYKARKQLKGKRFPCVINFHGGGFVLGTAHDDARWVDLVVQEVGAVVVSVDYRLAPEFPFPTAVEDGADAILYLARHADELWLDSEKFAISGFSSGGNMCFTVPLCLQGELLDKANAPINPVNPHNLNPDRIVPLEETAEEPHDAPPVRPTLTVPSLPSTVNNSPHGSRANLHSSRVNLTRQRSRLDRIAMMRQTGTSTLSLISTSKVDMDNGAICVMAEGVLLKIRGIVSFYPSTDYTQTREQRRLTTARKDQNLPAVFTELFDDSYLQPPSLDLAHPWLSPGVAPDAMLAMLPDDIVLFTCEWDMLLAEGERLRDRLTGQLGKRVRYHCVPGVPHGWDKAPNPLRESPGAREQYQIAAGELRRMFGLGDEDDGEV